MGKQVRISDSTINYEIVHRNIKYPRMKSKWGSCSSKKNLTINTLLKYLPEEIIEYVIFHEMVHLIERKHNEKFWKIISNKFENYDENEKELFEYWFLIQEVVGVVSGIGLPGEVRRLPIRDPPVPKFNI